MGDVFEAVAVAEEVMGCEGELEWEDEEDEVEEGS